MPEGKGDYWHVEGERLTRCTTAHGSAIMTTFQQVQLIAFTIRYCSSFVIPVPDLSPAVLLTIWKVRSDDEVISSRLRHKRSLTH